MLPDSDPSVADFQYIINHIPAAETVYINIENKGTDLDTFKQAADFVYEKISNSPFYSSVLYQISTDKFLNLLNLVEEKKWVLLDKTDLETLDEKMSQPRMDKIIVNIKRNLLSPSGFFMADKVAKDPFSLNEQILSKLDAVQTKTSNVKFESGRIFSKDEKHLLMLANPVFPAVDTQTTDKMIRFLDDVKQQVNKKFGNKIYVGVSGNHIATYDNSITIQKDVKRALIVLSIGIIAIGFLFFSRKIYIFLVFVPTLVSLTFATALMSLANTQISAIALGCGAVLVGITVDFGIHILFSIDNSKDKPINTIIAGLKKPIAAGACTTTAAFSCLLFSSLPGQRQIGFFSMVGVGCAAFFAVYILKYFVPIDKKVKRAPLISLVNFCNHFMTFRRKHIKPVAVCCSVIILVSLIGITDFKFEGDVSKLNHLTPTTKYDTDTFLKTWGSFSPSIVLVKAKTLEKALEKNDRLFSLLQNFKQEGRIDNIDSLSHIFPSQRKRAQNFSGLKKSLTLNKISRVEKMFDAAAQKHGFSKNIFQPFFDDLAKLHEKTRVLDITRKDFKNTAIEPLIDEKLIFRDHLVLVLTTFTIKDDAFVEEIAGRIKNDISGSKFLNQRNFVKKITSYVSHEFKQLFGFAAVAMVIVVFAFFRNIKIVLITVTPVFLSVLTTAGILGLAGIEINLISTLFVVFVFGIGIDFSIFLTNFEITKQNHQDHIAAGAIILCAMSTMGAFTCLIFADHRALFSIGAAGLTGMLTSLVLSLILVPTLTELIFKRKQNNIFKNE